MPAAPTDHELAAARARWSAAEARVYPLAMVSVPAYQQAIEAVGTVLAFLREDVQDHGQLLAFSDAPAEALERLDLGQLTLVGLAVDDLVAAACASRDRELTQVAEQQRRVSAFRTARSAGEAWVEVPARQAFGLRATVPELVVHLGLARGLLTTLEPDLETGEPRLRMIPVDADLDTGALLPREEGDAVELVVGDRDGWDATVRSLATAWGADVDDGRHP